MANIVVGVAEETTSTIRAPVKAVRTIALPTPAGLKMFWPKPPKTSLPKKIPTKQAMTTAWMLVLIGTHKARIRPVTQGKEERR